MKLHTTSIIMVVALLVTACKPQSVLSSEKPSSDGTITPTVVSAHITRQTGTPDQVGLTPAQEAALQFLSGEHSLPAAEFQLVSSEAIDWPDGCLGVVRLGVMCARGIVSGFRLVFSAGDYEYEVHTNQDGSSLSAVERRLSLVVRSSDFSLKIEPIKIAFGDPAYRFSTGLNPAGGASDRAAYGLSIGAMRLDSNGQEALDFVHSPLMGFGVYPGSPARLAWSAVGEHPGSGSSLWVSSPDGLDAAIVYQQPPDQDNSMLALAGWAADGQSLYFSQEPFGIDGYFLFGGVSSLFRFDLRQKNVQTLAGFTPQDFQVLCWDDLSQDEQFLVGHCSGLVMTVMEIDNGSTTQIQPPAELLDQQLVGLLGSARFSPDNSRIAYALAKGDPQNEQTWVAVSDGLQGESHVILTSPTGHDYTVLTWLNNDTILLQSNQLNCAPDCSSELWMVKADGSGLRKVADGSFIAIMPEW